MFSNNRKAHIFDNTSFLDINFLGEFKYWFGKILQPIEVLLDLFVYPKSISHVQSLLFLFLKENKKLKNSTH